MKRIAVLVSGGGTNLQALIDAQNRGEIVGGEIAAVISSAEGAYALERAAKAGIPGYVMARKSYDSNRAMTVALVEKLKELDIDLVVLAGFMILSQLGIASQIVNTAFEIFLAAVAVAFALAFGLGGKDFAKKTLDKVDEKIEKMDDNK